MPMVSDKHCKSKWGRTFSNKTMICAGYIWRKNGPRTCKGDSGGPLICHENGQAVLTGVVSFGKRGCTNDRPKVFARVSNYLRWIRKFMKKHSSSPLTTTTRILKTTITTTTYNHE